MLNKHVYEFQDTVTQFGLRGLCASSTLDTVYKVRQDLSQVLIVLIFDARDIINYLITF